MDKLTVCEKAFLECLLDMEKKRAEEFVKNNSDNFTAYFVENETLPMIASILNKLNNDK